MFNELISVSRDGNVFLEDNTISVLPKMWEVYKTNGMGSNMVKWIVSVYDYSSPLRRLPLDERKRTAAHNVWQQEKHPRQNHEKVKEAIDEYKKLQFDPLKDQYMAMSEKIIEMTNVFAKIKANAENLADLNKIQQEMFKASEARDKLKQLILKDQESETKLFGTDTDNLSFMEQKQRMEENGEA